MATNDCLEQTTEADPHFFKRGQTVSDDEQYVCKFVQ